MSKIFAILVGAVVVFWNVENFFDPFDDKAKNDDDFTPKGRYGWTFRRFEVKSNSIAKAILSIGVDYGSYPEIIGLAEIENSYVLKQLTEHTPLFKLDYGIIHFDSPDLRGIDVALLYRKDAFKPLESEALAVKIPTGTPTRDILYARGVLYGTDTLDIFVNHWPSRLGGDIASQPRRMAAMKALMDKISELGDDDRIILMGDFNQPNPLQDTSLVQYDIPEGTIKSQGMWEQIDYFYTSHNLSERAGVRAYHPGFLIEDDKTYMGFKPFRTSVGPRYNGGVSDHFPIIMLLE